MIANGMGAACKNVVNSRQTINEQTSDARRNREEEFRARTYRKDDGEEAVLRIRLQHQNNHTQTKDEEKYLFITLTLTHLKHDGSMIPGDATVRRRTFPVSTPILSSTHFVCDRKNPREVFGLLAEKSHQKLMKLK